MTVGTLCVRHDASSAALVRAQIAEDLAARRVTRDSVDDVVLVASELVGNAVIHAGQTDDLGVAWDLQDDTVIVRVYDGSTTRPQLRHADPDATHGRGLAIVAAIAAEWGVSSASRGKQVWARVPVCTTDADQHAAVFGPCLVRSPGEAAQDA